jgi:hypothetical protein
MVVERVQSLLPQSGVTFLKKGFPLLLSGSSLKMKISDLLNGKFLGHLAPIVSVELTLWCGNSANPLTLAQS